MESLEQINGETCVSTIRVMKETYVSEDELKCRNCTNHNQECYRPIKYFEIPLNNLRFKQCKDKFDTIILDPPYAYRKSMEMYNGHKASKFNQIKDMIPKILNKDGIVITFGYHSVSMGNSRGFIQEKILLLSHGGVIHDTIAVIEKFAKLNTSSVQGRMTP